VAMVSPPANLSAGMRRQRCPDLRRSRSCANVPAENMPREARPVRLPPLRKWLIGQTSEGQVLKDSAKSIMLMAEAEKLNAYCEEGLEFSSEESGFPHWEKVVSGRAPIRIAVYFAFGTQGSPTRFTIFSLLGKSLGLKNTPFVITGIGADSVRRLTPENYDVVIFPGGRGDHQAAAIGKDGLEAIKAFVSAGGGYIGVCGGASLAISYLKFYGDVPIERPWDRGKGDVRVEITDEGHDSLQMSDCYRELWYGQGPIITKSLVPSGVKVLANFRTEINYSHTEQTRGKMLDMPAILSCSHGLGRVLTTSVHPESNPNSVNEPMGDFYLGFLSTVAPKFFQSSSP